MGTLLPREAVLVQSTSVSMHLCLPPGFLHRVKCFVGFVLMSRRLVFVYLFLCNLSIYLSNSFIRIGFDLQINVGELVYLFFQVILSEDKGFSPSAQPAPSLHRGVSTVPM
jgi:hypothetical protein